MPGPYKEHSRTQTAMRMGPGRRDLKPFVNVIILSHRTPCFKGMVTGRVLTKRIESYFAKDFFFLISHSSPIKTGLSGMIWIDRS